MGSPGFSWIGNSLLAVAILLATPLHVGATPEQTCEGGRNGAVGKFASCLHKAQQKFVAGGETDTAARDEAIAKCTAKFGTKWQALEDKAGPGVCPSADESGLQQFEEACVAATEAALGGGSLPLDVVACNSDLTTCGDDLADCEAVIGTLSTGQTTCYDAAGTMIACAGTGQDGEFQQGVARAFTDNGDGTITEAITGLMWEKLSNDGTVHDKDNAYGWGGMISTKVSTLNSTSFAGYNDWRVPNIFELETLRNLSSPASPLVYPEFSMPCPAACTVLTCSCTDSGQYWSSTTYLDLHDYGMELDFANGWVGARLKSAAGISVRLVRGGY